MKPGFQTDVLQHIRGLINPLKRVKNHFFRQSHHVANLNMAPLTGRRDAAIERLIELLKDNLFAIPQEERLQAYRQIIELLEDAIAATSNICHQHDERRMENETGLLQYLLLIRDILQTQLSMLLQQVTLRHPPVPSPHPCHELFLSRHSVQNLLAENEAELYHSISVMMDLSRQQLVKYQEYCRKIFSKQSVNRYQRALDEFRKIFTAAYPGIPTVELPLDNSMQNHPPQNS